MAFVGPNGETPGKIADLVLTDQEKAKVKSGHYKAAFVWHTSSEFVSAVEKGAREEFKELGIDVVASTQANFDAATQANNLQTVLALNPDIIVTIAVDPVSAEATFKPAVDKGVKLVIMTTPPANYQAGKQFVSIVTESLTDAGKLNATILGDALGGQGEIGYMYHDADFWFTNQRDKAFKSWTQFLYPNQKIVAEEGFSAVAYVVLTVSAKGWTLEEAGDRDPAGARLGAMLQVLAAREPSHRPPLTRTWWPRGFPVPPQLHLSDRTDMHDLLMIRPFVELSGPFSADDVFYWRSDYF